MNSTVVNATTLATTVNGSLAAAVSNSSLSSTVSNASLPLFRAARQLLPLVPGAVLPLLLPLLRQSQPASQRLNLLAGAEPNKPQFLAPLSAYVDWWLMLVFFSWYYMFWMDYYYYSWGFMCWMWLVSYYGLWY